MEISKRLRREGGVECLYMRVRICVGGMVGMWWVVGVRLVVRWLIAFRELASWCRCGTFVKQYAACCRVADKEGDVIDGGASLGKLLTFEAWILRDVGVFVFSMNRLFRSVLEWNDKMNK